MSYPRSRKRLISATNAWWAAPAAFLATVMALPVNATIVVPDEPLTTGARVASNILFVLDDSGSMAFDYMPDDVPRISPGGSTNTVSTRCTDNSSANEACYANNRNRLAYNPATEYQPWMQADGNRMTGGTTYGAVYGSFNRVGGGTINLGSSSSCRRYNYNSSSSTVDEWDSSSSSGINICGGVQTFYVLRDPTRANENAYASDTASYYRYQILEGGSDIVRSEYGPVEKLNPQVVLVNNASSASGEATDNWQVLSLSSLPAGGKLDVLVENTSTGDKTRNLNYRVSRPNGDIVCEQSVSKKSSDTCSIDPTLAGVYTISVRRNNDRTTNFRVSASFSGYNSCNGSSSGTTWVNCTSALPASRTLSQELTNYATWFSYHRTRMKAAKAGASDAFRPLGNKVRVGFHTIHQRNQLDIPVDDGNDGRFVNNVADPIAGTSNTTSRTQWYNRLHAALGRSGTPLIPALDRAGKYFENTAASGPYGPQAGNSQYTCRQNFTILTTDGYWNEGSVSYGNVDNSAGDKITGPGNRSFTYAAANPYKDDWSNTLADVAMYYWKRDLRTDLTNNVPSSDANPAFWQHMVTFGISIGLKGTLDETTVAKVVSDGRPRKNGSLVNWPKPVSNAETTIDDLLHAAVNGRGAFVAATNPSEFTAGLAQALATIAQRTSSFSNVATNAASIRQGGKVFNANYVSGLWTGAVKAWTLDSNNNPAAQAWEASIPAFTSRKVYTFNGSSGTAFPTTAQEGLLLRTGGPVDYPVSGSENANYIKGDASKEERNGGLLRNRTTVLGDIVGSSPAYVDDTKTLYVGANDGMLHAFNADTGVELFAYVPSMINFNHLATLSRGDYEHKWFVDGPVVVSDRKLTPGKNLLVGALGRGGKGLFGLDVSSPATFGAGNVKWELRDTPGNHMGLVTGRPILTRLTDGTKVAILGNGINSTNHKAVLLVVNIETGAVVREYDTGAGSSTAFNGLSAPTATLGPDGRSVQYAYAGDRLGNVWKFDLTKAAGATGAVTKLFSAKSADGTGAVQPITGAVTVATDPRTYKRWVLFGTGSFVTTTEADDKTANKQSLYGFIDDNAEVAYSDLQKRNIINTGQMVDGYPVRSFEAQASLPANKKGWFVNLPGAGERVVQDSQVVANILLTASMIPEGDACEASGSGYINAVDAFTGTSAGKSFFDLDGDGDTTDTLIGGVPVGSVNFGVGMPTLPIVLDGKLVVGGTGGSTGSEKPGSGGIIRMIWNRVSWREIRAD